MDPNSTWPGGPDGWLRIAVPFGSALVGGLLAVCAQVVAYYLQRRSEVHRELRQVRRFLQAIHDELDTLWSLYYSRVGVHIESLEKGKPFLAYWDATGDYLTIYRNNAALLGLVDDIDIRKEIIATYCVANSLLDTFRINNMLLRDLETRRALRIHEGSSHLENEIRAYAAALAEYATGLRAVHEEFKLKVTSVQSRIEKKLGGEKRAADRHS